MKIIDGVLTNVSAEDIINGNFNIPNSVHTIGKDAFKGLANLKTISIPESVKKIENNSFENCHFLESIEIPKSVEEIGGFVFKDCKSLKNLKLNEGLKTIQEYAFAGCSNLLNVSIPNSVNSIGHHCFSMCKGIKKLILPETLKEINPYTFEDCSSLTTVKLPETLEVLGRNAFMDCSALTSIKVPEKVKEINICTFYKCSNLSHISLPNTITKIDDAAFGACRSLRTIKLPTDLKSIGKHTFSSCSSLRSITIPKSVRTIDNFAFNECLNLKHLEIEEGVTHIGKSTFNQCGMKKLTLPKSVKHIKDSAFNDCPRLKVVDIKSEMTEIPDFAFTDCYSLEKVNLPENIKTIGQSAFHSCSKLKTINLPESLNSIYDSAFTACTSLVNIELPSNLTSLGYGTFYNCHNLKFINIPEKVLTIPDKTFYNCESLENVTLGQNLLTIGEKAFDQCRKLKNINLPKSIKTIKDGAFRNCYSITELYIPKTIEYMGQSPGLSLSFYNKDPDGFSFFKTQDETNENSRKKINIDFAILSSNWDNAQMLLAEQNNPQVASFYNTFFSKLPKSKADEFLKSHNFTFFKQIASKYNISNANHMKALYNLGAFLPPDEYDGKTINYSQKVCGLLLEKFNKGKVKSDDIFMIGSSMGSIGFKKEFTDFFLSNFDEFIAENRRQYGFVAKCYERFDEIQKTNTSNRGRQRRLQPTIKKFKEYLEENRYEGITPETRPIANAVSKYFGAQFAFDRGVEIMEEKKIKGTRDHILSKPLKEEKTNSPSDPFETIDKTATAIEKTQTETLQNLVKTAHNEFTYEWLSKNDPENLILGKLCDCCAHIDGMGYGIMRASIIDPNVQNLVIRDENNQIIAKATFFVNPKDGYGVFNTVQVSQDLNKARLEQVYEKFISGTNAFIEQYNIEHPEKPLTQVNVGMGLNDIEVFLVKNNKKAPTLLKSINYSRYGGHGNYYEGDCFNQQYIVWQSDGKKFVDKLLEKKNQLLLPGKSSNESNENTDTLEK